MGEMGDRKRQLVDLVDGRSGVRTSAASTTGTAGHATRHTAGHSLGHAASLVQLGDDGRADLLDLLQLVVELLLLGRLVGVQPLERTVARVQDLLLVVRADLGGHLLVLDRLFHVEAVGLERVL